MLSELRDFIELSRLSKLSKLSRQGELGKQKNSDTKSTFETLEVWKAARDLRKVISQIVRDFPNPERFRLSDQMLRASRCDKSSEWLH